MRETVNRDKVLETDIAARRLRSQRLTGEPFHGPVEAVGWFAAVQAQDFAGAKWALGQRTRDLTDAGFDRLYDAGAVLRTHVLRPTWHCVLAEDVRWLLELTAPRIWRSLVARHRQLEIDGAIVAGANRAFERALGGGRHLTRGELGAVLEAAGIAPDGQRLAHLLMGAELDALIVSGPRRGRQHTYALLDERAPRSPRLDRDASLAELATRYFRSHGPAQLQDFVWWSGLTVADARQGIVLAGPVLNHRAVEGRDYWTSGEARPARRAGVDAHLLPNFDEYLVAYRDRSAALHPDRPIDTGLLSFGSILSNVVTIGGQVRGAWRRTAGRHAERVEIRLFDAPTAAESATVARAGERLSRFLERPVELAWSS